MINRKPHTVLVAVASRHGSTAEIAARIARRLREHLTPDTWQIDEADTDTIHSFDDYDAVVLGSAIYLGRWLKSARKLLENTEGAPRLGMWMFSSGPVGEGPDDDELPVKEGDLAARLGATVNRVFAGRISKASLSRVERIAISLFRVSDGDFRDWEAIDSWAVGIANDLKTNAIARAHRR